MPEQFEKTKVYFARDKKEAWRSDFEPFKESTANTPEELEGLLRLGWKKEKTEE